MQRQVEQFMNKEYLDKVMYGDDCYPCGLLGPHKFEDGFVVSSYNPAADAIQVKLKDSGEVYDLEMIGQSGIYATFIPNKESIDYVLDTTFYNGDHYETEDPYSFPFQLTEVDMYLYGQGTHYNIYEKLGAHKMTINGVEGVHFAVWAPNARRVSVVGQFNSWDGRVHQMSKVGDIGFFEIFIPRIKEGELYKFEIKTREGWLLKKSDPYGNACEVRPNTASIVCDLSHFDWKDEKWLEKRDSENTYEKPMAIYEVHPGSWKKSDKNPNGFLTYRELAHELTDYVLDMGYTHVELMGIAEHPFDGSWGYQVTGYYAPTSRFGSPEDFMYLVNYLHEHGIGVILDWVPAHFPKDTHGLARFDGGCLYEHYDPKKGEHPHWGTLIFDYGKREVRNFLIANALFWIEKFHVDGLRVDAVASMLYLDYGKEDGEWIPNQYGGRENLDAVEFLKHLNSIVAQRDPGALVIAEESTSWGGVSAPAKDGGLGFSYKWNMGWMNDFLEYISKDPIYRQYDHWKLTFSMVYAYTEKFILVLSHDEVVHGKGSMINKMPGDYFDKFANLRVAYGFMFGHPGKKLLFMGQDIAQWNEWNEAESLDWYVLDDEIHRKMQNYVKALLHFYREQPALTLLDHSGEGFEWINCNDAASSIVSFIRKTPDGKRCLLFVCNFTPVPRKEYRVGAPTEGEYTQVFTSDLPEYGGTDSCHNGTVCAEPIPWDGKPQSIEVDIPPLGIVVLEYNY